MKPVVEKYSFEQLLATAFTPKAPLITGLVQQAQNILLVAPQKSGKSVLSLQLGLCLASGVRALEWEVKEPRRVLYYCFEMTGDEVQAVVRRLAKACGISRADFHLRRVAYLPLNNDESFNALTEDVMAVKPHLLVLDPLYRLVKGSLKDDDVANVITARLNTLSMSNGHATLIPHHTHRLRRDGDGLEINEGVESYFGSFVWTAWVDKMYMLSFKKAWKEGEFWAGFERKPEFGGKRKVWLRDEEDALAFETGGVALGKVAREVLERLPSVSGLGVREIARVLDAAHSQVSTAIDELLDKGLVEVVREKGKKTRLVRKEGWERTVREGEDAMP